MKKSQRKEVVLKRQNKKGYCWWYKRIPLMVQKGTVNGTLNV